MSRADEPQERREEQDWREALDEANDAVQDWCTAHPGEVPPDLQRLIDLLDFVVNGP